MDEYQLAMDDKNNAIAEAERCERKLNLAQRLVGALGSELDKWSQSIIDLSDYLGVIIGDVLLAAAFVSYVGPFNKSFRDQITNNFIATFKKFGVPMSPEGDPLGRKRGLLADDAQIAGWNNCGLPPDRVSTENGAILANSERYSLLIDP